MPQHIAVVDDESAITELLAHYFAGHGFRATQLHSGHALMQLMASDPPELVLLDLGLPGEDGFAIARQIRERWHCGLVIITGRGDAVDKVVGLEVGADDYVTKPFDLRELVARVKAVLRRVAPVVAGGVAAVDSAAAAASAGSERLHFLGWQLDLAARRLDRPCGTEVRLTTGEFELLATLAQHPGRVLSRDFLLERTRGREAAPFDRTIDVQVGRLRKKLEADAENPQIIKSVRGAGYIFIPPVTPAKQAPLMASASPSTTPPGLPQAVDDLSVYRSLFAAYPDALLLVDADGRIVRANPAATALLGYASDELVGLSVDELVPDSIRPRHASYRQAYGGAPRARPMGTQMELVAKRRDGSEVMVEIALSPLQSHGLPFVVAAIRGIGAYPRVKQALLRARHSEHLAQLGRMAVNERDPQQLLMQVPAIAAHAMEVEFASVLLLQTHRLEFSIVGRFGEIAGEPLGARLANHADTPAGYVLSVACPVVVDDLALETRFAVPATYLAAGITSMLAVPLSDRGRMVGVLCVQSRSARQFSQDETRFLESMANLLATCLQRAQSEEALNHAQRLESVGQLTGGIAHDFNNLLTVIQGNLQVLEELPALADADFGQQLVSAATRAARRGAELTAKLLAFSRRQVLQPSAVDVGALLHSLSDMLRRTLDQRIQISVELAEGCPAVLADPGQLEAALLNIAINARDAMPEGGTLRFTAGLAGTLPAPVRREIDDASAQDERYVRIAIADTGSGMPEEVKERAFEPFFTTKQAGRGTGLGLSTVYGFAKQSRGAVAIESALGAGTTISLYLPRPWAERISEPEPGRDAATIAPGLKVLLVEDDAEVRAVARQFLDMLGCQVTASSTAEQALLLLTPEATFDLLLTDIALGAGMRGTELARLAQVRLPRLAILLMSGFSAELLDADRDSPPGWELLPKPYSRSELAQAIARVLAP